MSGPAAFDAFRFRSSFSIPFWSIVRGSASGKEFPGIFKLVGVLSLVKTEQNWSRRILAFFMLSLSRNGPFFRGAIPELSCRLDLTYLQNGFWLFSY